jgi:hypothetical protein
MSGGSYLRFALGALLSLTVIVSFLAHETVSGFSALLAFIFLLLTAAWILFKF